MINELLIALVSLATEASLDVVKAMVGFIFGQPLRGINLNVQQVTDDVGVLGSCQPSNGVNVGNARLLPMKLIESPGNRCAHTLVFTFLGTLCIGRRHLPGLQPDQDLFPVLTAVQVVGR